MSLNGCFWLSAASISSRQRQASDSQWFAHYGVNRLLTRHLEAQFHLNVTVVYLTREHWGWNSPPSPQTGPGCRRHRRVEFDSQLEAATSVQATQPPCFCGALLLGTICLWCYWIFFLWPCVYNSACVQCRPRDMRVGASLRPTPVFPKPPALSLVPCCVSITPKLSQNLNNRLQRVKGLDADTETLFLVFSCQQTCYCNGNAAPGMLSNLSSQIKLSQVIQIYKVTPKKTKKVSL